MAPTTSIARNAEAEGFRRITYFLDRPDILSVYTVRVEAAHNEAPLLLSNGNPVERGALANGRHYAVWHDPFPKPFLPLRTGGRRAGQGGGQLHHDVRP
ncbi:hypothetical protein ACVOMV_29750 [Mesorhizobium atlanticum]